MENAVDTNTANMDKEVNAILDIILKGKSLEQQNEIILSVVNKLVNLRKNIIENLETERESLVAHQRELQKFMKDILEPDPEEVV